MDKLAHYQSIIEKVFLEIQALSQSNTFGEALLALDHERKQYILMSNGWEGNKRHYYPLLHVEIRPETEVCLHCDQTDLELGRQLIEQGIERADVVLGFYSPQMREYARQTLVS